MLYIYRYLHLARYGQNSKVMCTPYKHGAYQLQKSKFFLFFLAVMHIHKTPFYLQAR